MLSGGRRTRVVATASVFAALWAVLGFIQVSKLVLGTGFLTASNLISPLVGMLLGPLVGAFTAIVGDLIGMATGQINFGATGVAVMGADVAVVVTAGLAFSGKARAALAIPVAVLVLYTVDPLSVIFVGTVPFTWLHMVSFAALGAALYMRARGKIGRLNPLFLAAVNLGALAAGQLTGTLIGQNLSVRVYDIYSPDVWRHIMADLVFPAYQVERPFFAAVGTLISIPVLRAVFDLMRKRTVTDS